MAGNRNLNSAKTARKDEFYTQLTDIEKEMRYYRKHFKGKTVLCNCDDPFESNFFKYFVLNFNRLGLKKLIATCYSTSPIAGNQLQYYEQSDGQLSFSFDEKCSESADSKRPYKAVVTKVYDVTGDGGIDMVDVAELFKSGDNALTQLNGDGDFRSLECVNLLDEADIVVTNPPFSLFREFVSLIVEHQKNFIIIGNQNAISYEETFSLMKNNKMWIGASIHSGDRAFFVPDDYPLDAAGCGIDEETGRKYIRVKGVRWFTNLDIKQRHEEMILVRRYVPDEYPTYVYGDNVFEKHGINRDRTGDREKTRYLCGKQGIFTRDRALIRPGSIRQLETRASTRSASFFHALGGPGRPYNGGGAAGAYCTHNGAKPLKQGHLRAKRGPLGPSRKSQQQTKRTGFAAHGHSIAETASEGKRASRANGALNRAKINGRGQKQGFGGVDRRRGGVTSCYSRRYDDGGDRAITGGKCGKAILHFPHSRVEL